jgi:hypothetical protein
MDDLGHVVSVVDDWRMPYTLAKSSTVVVASLSQLSDLVS